MRPRGGQGLDLILIGTAGLSAFLNTFYIWKDSYANAYYTAAVTSMLQSFHNFFYASLDPGGFITVDKPPVAFWMQTLFARVFGAHGWSVILPQALAGVGSVLLIYSLVRPAFGKTAARLAGLTMACTPIAVAVSRTNNIDSLLVFTLLLATWMLFRAVREQKVPWALAAFAMIGVGFNLKMFQAYMVVPAFLLFWLLAFKWEWKKKLALLTAATIIMVGVSLSWALVVDAIPQENRPYIGGSRTNSVLELAFAYNGMQRLLGGMGPGGGPGQPQAQPNRNDLPDRLQTAPYGYNPPGGQQMPSGSYRMPDGQPGRQEGSPNMPGGQPALQDGNSRPGGGSPAGNGAPRQGNRGMFGTGLAGPLRLFQSELSGQISWLLPLVALAGIGLLAGIRRRKPLTAKQNETLFWLAWLLPTAAFFSIAGFFHHYYLIMLAPPIAALTGAGWVELWSLYRARQGWTRWLLPAGLLATTAFELHILQPYQGQIGIAWLMGLAVAGLGLALLLLLASNKPKPALVAATAGILVLLAAPLCWSATPLLYGDNYVMPQAGPRQQGFGSRQGGGGESASGINHKLFEYLSSNNTGETYLFATTDASTAESYIINTGKAVMAMGGFSGSDPALTVEKLKQMVANRKVKFFLLGGGRGGSNEVLEWIRANSTEVPREEWQSDSSPGGLRGMGSGSTLYKINE